MSRHQHSITRAGRAVLRRSRPLGLFVITSVAVLAFAGCATTGATFRSGVGDSFPERPPYRAGAPKGVMGATRVAILPVA